MGTHHQARKRRKVSEPARVLSAPLPSVEQRVVGQMGSIFEERRDLKLRVLFPEQQRVKDSKAKRKIVRAGRRGGKTVGCGRLSIDGFLAGRRVLYATPTSDQLDAWWYEVTTALRDMIEGGVYRKNETDHSIERAGTKQRLRGKTAWNADTLRGDYADLLILDEYQLMSEDAWDRVGLPMLLDNDGDAILIYTPPSMTSKSVTKARDPQNASKMFTAAVAEMELARREKRQSLWEAFTWSSRANPHISAEALGSIARDMTMLSYRQEILAEDLAEAPGAMWTMATIERGRLVKAPDTLLRVGVGVDPPGGVTECGIVAAGIARCFCKGVEEIHGFVLDDKSLRAPPAVWGREAVTCYAHNRADRIYGEQNFGGDMVESTIRTVDEHVPFTLVRASRGKAIRAEPIAALYEQGRVHHVGQLPGLEGEMISWIPGISTWSPNRVDALIWALTEYLDQFRKSAGGGGIGVGVGEPITAGLMREVI